VPRNRQGRKKSGGPFGDGGPRGSEPSWGGRTHGIDGKNSDNGARRFHRKKNHGNMAQQPVGGKNDPHGLIEPAPEKKANRSQVIIFTESWP